jgi:anti-anti-sigma regulatory factor
MGSIPVAIRPGEHACCRLPCEEDRELLVTSFVRHGLSRGRKVVLFDAGDDVDAFASRLAGSDDDIAKALARGQLEIKSAREAYIPDGAFDAERMLATARSERERALAAGYRAASFTGDMRWRLTDPPGCEQLAEYEQRLAEILGDEAIMLLCQYDDAVRAEVTAAHDVDVAPELAPIGRCGYLAAALTGSGSRVRLAGELDFEAAATVAAVIDERGDAPICLDLADLEYVDVAGLRALRGSKRHPIAIATPSDAVQRLVGLLGWDTDPGVQFQPECAA